MKKEGLKCYRLVFVLNNLFYFFLHNSNLFVFLISSSFLVIFFTKVPIIHFSTLFEFEAANINLLFT